MSTKKAMAYRVDYELDQDGNWTAVIDRSQGVSCVTFARSLGQARRRIREALAAHWDDEARAQAVELKDNVKLPAPLRSALNAAESSRQAAQEAAAKAAKDTASSTRLLLDRGLSLRDAADLMNVSYQRIHQLADERVHVPPRERPKAAAKRAPKPASRATKKPMPAR